jgi:aspartate-semialdehyde dehydrogenase
MLYARSAATVKRLVLELGGHAPFLVFADADLDRAVAEAIKAKFATTGQDCLGANRILVERRSMTPSPSASPPRRRR